jgi:hypothetical protein
MKLKYDDMSNGKARKINHNKLGYSLRILMPFKETPYAAKRSAGRRSLQNKNPGSDPG